MKQGVFYNANENKYMLSEDIENQLPEIFLTDSMKKYKYPKVEYLTLLGITCCGGSTCIDKILIDRIIENDELYHKCIEFLCDKYNFYSLEVDDYF